MSLFSKICSFFRFNSLIDPEIKRLLDESESKKIIRILRKDAFDEKYSNLVETGFLSPIEYYRWKAYFLDNSLNF